MAKILGLDLGTNSIGWAVVDDEKEGNQIVNKGVRIFSEGVKIEKGIEKSKAAERTGFRSARRIKFRRKLRKYETLKALIQFNMCPLSIDELNLWRQERIYPQREEFKDWLRTHENKNPYYFRAKAVEGKMNNQYNLGRAFYHIAQRRGFLSNRLDTSQDNSDKSPVKSNIKELTAKMNGKTLGQYFYEQHRSAIRIRDNYTHREEHYLAELNKICEVQQLKEYKKERLYKAIFYQRPLRSQKGLIGKCSFESGKPRCPLSHPLFEEFRMLSFINNIKCESDDKFAPLTNEQREKIVPLFFRLKDHFDFKDISKALTPKGETIRFNYKDKTTVSGCPVSARLQNVFGEDWKKLNIPYKREKDGEMSHIDIYDVWHVLFTFDSDEKLEEFAKNRLQLINVDKIKSFLKIPIKQGYANLSLKAIRKMLPYLQEGLLYTYAAFLANMENVIGEKLFQENEALIKTELKNIIEGHREEGRKITIVNELIKNFRDEFNNSHSNYKLDETDKQNALDKIKAYYGDKTWEEFDEGKKDDILQWVLENFEKQLQKVKDNYIKQKRVDEKLKEFLSDNFDIAPESLKKLYHPSDIDTYKDAERNDDGKLYLDSPLTPSVKNPMAMRSLHQLRHLINTLTKEGTIDEHTVIRIELSRDLNDANKRKAIQSWQNDRKNENDTYKNEIKELYKAECGKDIEPTNDEILKYRLWIEQDKKCVYTGETIGICEFIGEDPKYDIEHTLPKSLSSDNSQPNKTLANRRYNRYIKKQKLPIECPNYEKEVEIDVPGGKLKCKAIKLIIEKWKTTYEELDTRIEKVKKASRAAQTKETKDFAIYRKHKLILERDYWKGKYERFTMTEIPQGFKNSQYIDTGIITKYARAYLRTVFKKVETVKGVAVAQFRQQWGLQTEYTKKERINHIHHAIDAVTISCMDRKRYDALAHYYHEEEQFEQRSGQLKPSFKPPWETFTKDVLSIVNDTLISHHTPNTALTQTKKKVRIRGKIQYQVEFIKDENGNYVFDKNGKKQVKKNSEGKIVYKLDDENNKIPIFHEGSSIRKSLHLDTIYGKIYSTEKKDFKFVTRFLKTIDSLKESDISKIVDIQIRKQIEKVGLKYAKENGVKLPVKSLRLRDSKYDKILLKDIKNIEEIKEKVKDYFLKDELLKQVSELGFEEAMSQGLSIPVKKVRCETKVSEPLTIKKHRDSSKQGQEYKQRVYAQNEEIYQAAIYEKEVKGKLQRKTKSVNMLELADYLQKKRKNKNERIFPTEFKGCTLSKILQKGTMVLFYNTSVDELNWQDSQSLSKRLYKVTEFSTGGRIKFRFHAEARNDDKLEEDLKKELGDKYDKTYKTGKSKFSIDYYYPKLNISPVNLNILVEGKDFKLSATGKIIKIDK